jgi:hypothetical protein
MTVENFESISRRPAYDEKHSVALRIAGARPDHAVQIATFHKSA